VPIAIFPLRIVLSAGIHAAFGLGAALVAIGILKGFAEPLALLALAPALVILAITAWSLACLCGILYTLFSDTQQIAEITLQALFYATPVIYLPESLYPSGWLHTLVVCNPFASHLELIRRPLLYSELPSVNALAIALAFMVMTTVLAWWSLCRVERRMVLWL
jgi:ABC-type polysaccharide/polyol phosphate export permease